jgi:HEPN/Toprim N-terminal domain 1
MDRLDLLGYTFERARKYFAEAVEEKIDHARETFDRYPATELKLKEAREADLRFYRELTFERWLDAISMILNEQIPRIYSWRGITEEQQKIAERDPFLFRILDGSSNERFQFPGRTMDYMYRAMFHVVPPDTPVFVDYSWLVDWVGPEQYSCSPPQTIVLTEGTSDKAIIEGSLRLLYPHLRGYFFFPDYEAVNFAGSSGNLLNIVRLLSATGTARRTVAVFDNDAAGFDAMRQLASIELDSKVKALMLPELPIAREYPTEGPQGRLNMDINGTACSIELYLGRDILQDGGTELTPVRWAGYLPGAGRYQGEIVRKRLIQEKYLQILADAAIDPNVLASHDWSDIRRVLQAIFSSFADDPPDSLYDEEDW